MKYVSTRGDAPKIGFSDALLAGLARDGGLYLPETWPQFIGSLTVSATTPSMPLKSAVESEVRATSS